MEKTYIETRSYYHKEVLSNVNYSGYLTKGNYMYGRMYLEIQNTKVFEITEKHISRRGEALDHAVCEVTIM